jgi:molybdate transport system substrate-binding protein
MKTSIGAALGAIMLAATPASAAELKILSAGAVEPGLHRAVALFRKSSGHDVKIQFNTAPQIAKRLADNTVADVLIAPPGALDGFAKDGKVAADGRVPVGRVGAGVTVRNDAPVPAVGSTDALKAAVLKADSLVYNTASTGIYLERMFDRLGIGAELKAKTVRHANGDAVMHHVIKGKGAEIGFGAITEIKMFEEKGELKYVGPLPADVQNYTSYAAALMTGATERDAANAFLKFLGTPEAKQAFVSAGIE